MNRQTVPPLQLNANFDRNLSISCITYLSDFCISFPEIAFQSRLLHEILWNFHRLITFDFYKKLPYTYAKVFRHKNVVISYLKDVFRILKNIFYIKTFLKFFDLNRMIIFIIF